MPLLIDHSSAADWATVLGAALALVAAVVGWFKVVRPKWRRLKGDVTGTRDAILGRDAIRDSITGREIEPALPGIGQRMATVEAAIVKLSEADQRITAVESQVAVNTERIGALERATQERIATRAENAAAMGLISKLHDKSSEDDEE